MDQEFDAIMAVLDAPAADTDAEAMASDAPEPESTLTESDDSPDAEPADVQPDDDGEAEPIEAAAPEAAPPPAPAPVDWNSDENPLKAQIQALLPLAQRQAQLDAALTQAAQIKQRQDLQNTIAELSDGDPERAIKITQLMGAMTAPLQGQAQAETQRAVTSQKLTTAMVVAAKNLLPEEQYNALIAEVNDLMTVEGPQVMEQRASSKRATVHQYESKITAKDQEIAKLRKQIAAKAQLDARKASGADLVDGGTGPGSGATGEEPGTMDEFMDALWAQSA